MLENKKKRYTKQDIIKAVSVGLFIGLTITVLLYVKEKNRKNNSGYSIMGENVSKEEFEEKLKNLYISNSEEGLPESDSDKSFSESILEEDLFSEQDAQQKIKNHKLSEDWVGLPNVPAGVTIFEFYVIRGESKGITNKGWFTEEVEKDKKYIVGFKESIGFGATQLLSTPRWEVTKESIVALNGKAISITPEFGPKETEVQGSVSDKEFHEYLGNLFTKYEDEAFDNNYLPSAEILDEAEDRAIKETAEKFNMTEDEVEALWIKLEMNRE